jgi:hypothetical protein
VIGSVLNHLGMNSEANSSNLLKQVEEFSGLSYSPF